jgi:hypothetical protein
MDQMLLVGEVLWAACGSAGYRTAAIGLAQWSLINVSAFRNNERLSPG